jgi:hypothetical protein
MLQYAPQATTTQRAVLAETIGPASLRKTAFTLLSNSRRTKVPGSSADLDKLGLRRI